MPVGHDTQANRVFNCSSTFKDMAKPRVNPAATEPPVDDPAWAGAAFYSRRNLRFYDMIVAFNCRVFMRCPRPRLVQLYDEHVSARHLDIGPATGWLLDACRFPTAEPAITLMDLNPDALAVASARLARYRPTTHHASALEPFGLPANNFDSVGMSLLLHCLPGAIPSKAVVLEHALSPHPRRRCLRCHAARRGCRPHDLSRRWMEALNRRGNVNNLDDNLDDLDAALGRTYREHELRIKGTVALFSARV
jgi:hypothetical protein